MGTQRIELCSKDFQSSAMSPDLPSTHIDLFASLPASPSISQGQNFGLSGYRETRTPLLQSPIQQFVKGGQIYSLLLLYTHSSPNRTRTYNPHLKRVQLYHSAIGEYVLPQGLEP